MHILYFIVSGIIIVERANISGVGWSLKFKIKEAGESLYL